ncbi:hypothetical protein F4680DRAFT_426347 [Xylaria scruposa]|nr:hypothetical protein F4680DRAFT_426347 [Xylaria scruposa]
MKRNSTPRSQIAYVEDADKDGHVLSGTEARYARPPRTSIRSPMIGVHTILSPAEQDGTQPTPLLEHTTISRDNTADENTRRSASFAYIGSRLMCHHCTSSKTETIQAWLHSQDDRSTISNSSLETFIAPPNTIATGFSDDYEPSSDKKNDSKAAITKTKYIRPRQPRVFCDQCDDYKEGFRGEHELRRHKDVKHQTLVKKFICIDPQELGLPVNVQVVNPLSKCKACKAQKKYGAYYNAAAHLRRSHFKKKSSRLGGDWPSMHELKNWMQEIYIQQDKQQLKEHDNADDSINNAQLFYAEINPNVAGSSSNFASTSMTNIDYGFASPLTDMAYTTAMPLSAANFSFNSPTIPLTFNADVTVYSAIDPLSSASCAKTSNS